jgi:hypothetical protein
MREGGAAHHASQRLTYDGCSMTRAAIRSTPHEARVVTDGLPSYDSESLGERPHEAKVQTKAERRENDAIQSCHWTISLIET